MDINIFLLILANFLILFGLCLIIWHIRNAKAVNKDMADAFKNLLMYLQNEFDSNLKTHEMMQKWQEDNLQIIHDKSEVLSNNDKIIQDFLFKLAQAMGFQRSNLDDL
jgi:hypothetical protein